MRNQLHLMPTTQDIIALLTTIEKVRPIKYTLAGSFGSPELIQARSFSEIKDFAVPRTGCMLHEDQFLLSDPELAIEVESIQLNKGGIKYSISHLENPKSLLLWPGGLFQNNIVISGELSKYSDEPEAKQLFSLFRRGVKKQFMKHESSRYWIGAEAAGMLAAGKLLTSDVQSTFALALK